VHFYETGLPHCLNLFRAFMDLQEMYGDNGAEGERYKKRAVRGAQILQENTDTTTKQLILPLLLFAIPINALNSVRKNYGQDYFLLIDEAYKHNITANTYLASANPDIRRVTAALAIAAFEEFSEDAQKIKEDYENTKKSSEFKTSVRFPLPVRFYDHLAKTAFDPGDKDCRLKDLYLKSYLPSK